VELAAETFDALMAERGDSGKIWASVLKEAIKRRKPDFSEGRYGFRTFGNLLEEAQARGLLEFGRDEKSGAYVYRGLGPAGGTAAPARPEGAGERASQGGATRHDFHAVATAADAPAGNGDSQGPSGRNRARRSDGTERADGRSARRTDVDSSGLSEAASERPASRYFSQPLPSEAAPQDFEAEAAAAPEVSPEAVESTGGLAAQVVASSETEPGSDAVEQPAAPRRSRARRGDDGPATDAAPRAAGRKTAVPRKRGNRGAADDGAEAAAAASAPEPAAAANAEGDAPAKAPTARPRSRARKPAAKPAE
jgi:hypothetical protein